MHHSTTSNELASPGLPVREVSHAAALAAASGGTGRLYQTRRGSFMILVVGTLALLAVITVLYVGIGRSDRQSAQAHVRQSRTEEVPEFFKEYARTVIGDATVSLYEIPKPPFNVNVASADREFIRKSWDYPDTDWNLQTYLSASNTGPESRFYFKPSGHLSGSSPFLASSTPTWLNAGLAGPPNNDPTVIYENFNDWAHISNFAPDGAFVNLYNLRSDAPQGGFDAHPSIMRRDVGLLNSNHLYTLTRDFGGNIRLNSGFPSNPADLDSRQAFLFQEIKLGNRVNTTSDDPQYMPYLYADTDGDGKYDARWIELREWRDTASQSFTSILPQDQNYRWFFAARCIDLSGRVNVNTATDFFNMANGGPADPTAQLPMGFTPAEVDLFRLLSLHDAWNTYTFNNGLKASYYGLNNFDGPNGPLAPPRENYSFNTAGFDRYEEKTAYGVARRSYSWLWKSFNDVTVHNASSNPVLPPNVFPSPAQRVLQYVTKSGRRDGVGGAVVKVNNADVPMYQSNALFSIGDLTELLTYWDSNDPAVRSRLEAVMGARNNDIVNGEAAVSADRSPLRDNRSLAVERDYVPVTGGGVLLAQKQGRLQAEIDVRHNLTTDSGAREIRGTPIIDSNATTIADFLSSSAATALNSSSFKYDLPTLLEQSTSTTSTVRGPALNDIFTGYADGLMPVVSSPAIQRKVWRGATPAVPPIERAKTRTRFYGYNWYDGPELPLLYSAFLAVNLADTYDEDSIPHCVTLLTNNAFRDELKKDYANNPNPTDGNEPVNVNKIPKPFLVDQPNGQLYYPWAHWTDQDQLDLNHGKRATGRLADNPAFTAATSTKAPAMNIYGLEATPFITQVGSITVYTDASQSVPGTANGDLDSFADSDNDNIPDGEVTITGDVVDTNPDLVMRVVAFQLSNPFDVDIILSYGGATEAFNTDNAFSSTYPAIDREQSFYYLEYAGRFYKLAELVHNPGEPYDDTTGHLKRLTLPAKSSIVVYILDRSKKEILERWKAFDSAESPTEDNLENWLRAQFASGTTGTTVEIPEFKPLDVDPDLSPGHGTVIHGGFKDPCNGAAPVDHNTVLLWRAVRAADYNNSQTNHEGKQDTTKLYYPRNSRLNDQLVDRYSTTYDPAGSDEFDLDRHLKNGLNSIGEAYGGPEVITPDLAANNYNSGITISYFTSSRRPDSPDDAALSMSAIPAWCIQPRFQTSEWIRKELRDQHDTAPNVLDFQGATSDYTFTGWRNKTGGGNVPGGSLAMLDEINMDALKRHSQPIGQATVAGTLKSFIQATDEFYLNNKKFSNPPNATGPAAGVRAMRLGDLFLPMCIGSFETPLLLGSAAPTLISQTYPAGGIPSANYIPDLRARWCTLSESLAVAIGYENYMTSATSIPPPLGEVATDVLRTFYTALPAVGGANPTRPVHDRGHLVLDDFVPFHDSSQVASPSVTTTAVFNRGNAANSDYTVGLGIPAALAVIDQFSLATPLLTDQTRSKAGLINLNTATRPVLSCIPMLAPIATITGAPPQWWWAGSEVDQRTDVVATLLAYRDKSEVFVRVPTAAAGGTPIQTFLDSTPDVSNLATTNGRGIFSQIKAIHEQPGLRSVGELLAVRNRGDAATAPLPFNDRSNIDFLGTGPDAISPPTYDSSRLGVDSILHSDDGSTFDHDTLIGEYDQKLALANGAFTASAVRSDYYAVYFVVQGYQKADTENLKPGDPMIPSIRRRFVVILDRSNVLHVGDKPRVLAFKELPN